MKYQLSVVLMLSIIGILSGITYAAKTPSSDSNQGLSILQDDTTRQIAIKGINIKRTDGGDGSYQYFAQFSKTAAWLENPDEGPNTIIASFLMCYPEMKRLFYLTCVSNKAVIINKTIHIIIADKSWDLSELPANEAADNCYSYHIATARFGVTADLYEAIMKTTGDARIQFTYQSLKEHFMRDISLPAEFRNEIQKLYTICQ